MIVIDALEAAQQHLALVHRRIEAQVAIDVGVDDEIGRLRDDDLVVDDRDAERRDQRGFLHEGMRRIGFAVVVGVLQHDDAIAFGLAGMMRAVADPFRHPDAAVAIDVDVGRVVQQRRRRPQRDFEALRHLKEVERNPHRLQRGRLARLRRRGRGLLGCDGPEHEDEHQDVRGRRQSRHVVSSRKARGILVHTHRAGDKSTPDSWLQIRAGVRVPATALFRVGGESRNVPAAAERLHELYAGHVSPGQQRQCRALIGELLALCGDDLEVADQAGAVLIQCDRG